MPNDQYILIKKRCMNSDISDILQNWDYDPEHNIRVLNAPDGRLILQVRQPLGIEQYEMDGRPDGSRPFGHETYLSMIEERFSRCRADGASVESLSLNAEDFQRLQNESILFYYRYLVLFQLNDFERVARDTDHNIRLCRLLESYCHDEDQRNSILQFRPYIIRMNSMARSMLVIQQHDFHQGVTILESAIQEIEGLEMLPSPVFQFERSRSLTYLGTALEQMREKDSDPRKILEDELKRALEEENYEQAAELRDQIRNLIDKGQSA